MFNFLVLRCCVSPYIDSLLIQSADIVHWKQCSGNTDGLFVFTGHLFFLRVNLVTGVYKNEGLQKLCLPPVVYAERQIVTHDLSDSFVFCLTAGSDISCFFSLRKQAAVKAANMLLNLLAVSHSRQSAKYMKSLALPSDIDVRLPARYKLYKPPVV